MDSAQKALDTAEYLLLQTYPAIQDNKLLVTVLQNLVQAIDGAISSALEKAKEEKEIGPYNKDNLAVKIELFRKRLAEKYGIEKKMTATYFEMENLLKMHKSSAFEFQRKDKYVITDDDMHAQELTEQKTKTYFAETKKLVQAIQHGI